MKTQIAIAYLNDIKEQYDTRKLTCTETFHEIKKVTGTFHSASKIFQQFWMDRP